MKIQGLALILLAPDFIGGLKTSMQTTKEIQISVVGCGMWGRNIARNCASLGLLHSVVDSNKERADEFAASFSCQALDFDAVCADKNIAGVMISASAAAHEALATAALQAGKHVFIEKPMALSLAAAKNINAAAIQNGREVMVGHLIRYHPVFQELLRQVENGAIGKLRHIQANRLAMGRIRNTESALFDLCPHDLSLILALTGCQPESVRCHGAAHITPGVADMLATGLGFANGITAGMNTSWLSPIKEHRLTVTGQSGSLVFDDTKPWSEKLTLFSDHIAQSGSLFVVERASPNYLPVTEDEPLKQEVRAFAQTCQTGMPALTNGAEGVAVQQVLEKMQEVFEMTNYSGHSSPPDNTGL